MTGTGGTAVYVEAPTVYTGDLPAVFLAGGITGCRDWQAQAYDQLADMPVAVLNPRRAHFPIDDPAAAGGQIAWEFEHLRRADVVLFWFPASDTVQPIALYELGAHAASGKLIAVGVDAGYPRRIDVMLQLGHVRPEVKVWGSLVATVAEARRLVAHVRR